MKIWIDFNNSPQVLFLRPIIVELLREGHIVEITTRDYAQTVQLADNLGFSHTVIGHHGGRGLYGLIRQNIVRAMFLARWARRKKFDLALSHNSYSLAVAASLLRIPSVTLMDYEHQPLNHICFRLAKRVIVPQPFPEEMVRKFGAAGKTARYNGVKEEVYLSDFVPDPDYKSQEGFPLDSPINVIRPPAPWTAYHRFENDLFDQLIQYLSTLDGVYNLFIPRIVDQVDGLKDIPNIHIAPKVYDGPNLLYHSDKVFSGGGTMSREAAVLGTPSFTLFKGKSAAVDRFLIEQGKLIKLADPSDFVLIAQTKKTPRQENDKLVSLSREITEMILDVDRSH
jgi:predicted glycosyltransferase